MRVNSRVGSFSALVVLAGFSACTSILGIEPPKDPQASICHPFVCENGICNYRFPGKNVSCGPLMNCDGKGECKGVFEAPCSVDEECVSGLCVMDQCKADTLAPCVMPTDCASGQCVDDLCRVDLLKGCMIDEECGYNLCVDGACRLPDGSGCDTSEECASRLCENTVCLRSDGATCTDSLECASGDCDGANCRISVGHKCMVNADCASGSCVGNLCTGQSCVQLPKDCGSPNTSCCESAKVTSESYNRNHHTMGMSPAPAIASEFYLDRFEVTVGRFRKFVEAYPDSKPANGAGQHSIIVGSAWNADWNAQLPNTRADLVASLKQCAPPVPIGPAQPTWTDTPTANENLPINCVNWYVAFAFCAWDGGRLPTEAEWGMAAGGGMLERQYPWDSNAIDNNYLTYNCDGNGNSLVCELADIHVVGSKSTKGDGRWSQTDLAGSMFEWVLDGYNLAYPSPCTDCAELTLTSTRVRRGGGWRSTPNFVTTSARRADAPLSNDDMAGIRCARNNKLIGN